MSEALVLNPAFGFEAMSRDEMMAVDGGGVLAQICGGILIVAGAVSAIVGVGVAVGTGGAAVLPGLKLAGAGAGAITAGIALINS